MPGMPPEVTTLVAYEWNAHYSAGRRAHVVDSPGEKESLAGRGPNLLGSAVAVAETSMSDSLTAGQLRALRNLADKRSGNITAFVNIADARHLTELGLAIRSRQGWDITAAGLACIAVADGPEICGGSSGTDLHGAPSQEGNPE